MTTRKPLVVIAGAVNELPSGDVIAGAQGVPAGGGAGQVLAKVDVADYHTEWVDQTGGGGPVNVTDVISSNGGCIPFSNGGHLNENYLLVWDNTNHRMGIGMGEGNPQTDLHVNGALRLSGTNVDTFTTPLGNSVNTKINIPYFNPGSYGQIFCFGLPSYASNSARALVACDARSGTHQPTIGVFSPDENNIAGLSWEGSNSVAFFSTTGQKAGFTVNGGNVVFFCEYTYDKGTLFITRDSYSAYATLAVNSDGSLFIKTTNNRIVIGDSRTISSSSAEGIPGETCWDSNYLYICVDINTWKRTALSSW